MPHKDTISWNSMLNAYVHHGLEIGAMNIFRQMIISIILTRVSALCLGIQIHGWVIRRGLDWNLSIANSLMVMYSSHERDVVSWNSIISAHCKCREALAFLEQMEEAVLVKEGERVFALMCEKYKIKPIMEHYGCMVNLYGRAGLIKKAYSIIVDGMGFEAAGPTLWGALLYACFLHGDTTIGEIAANRLFDLEPDNEHNFVLLMGIYENAGRLEDMERVRMMMVDRGLDY
ncbi:hypothetical protein V8G54_024260 [Vigna mungo]|uniref:Pentatricopeptide repeat-containing protein n=1 Tax=Vigna mungo TaxID=3915 RepID=A0AAQ3RT15_VIGMU